MGNNAWETSTSFLLLQKNSAAIKKDGLIFWPIPFFLTYCLTSSKTHNLNLVAWFALALFSSLFPTLPSPRYKVQCRINNEEDSDLNNRRTHGPSLPRCSRTFSQQRKWQHSFFLWGYECTISLFPILSGSHSPSGHLISAVVNIHFNP